MAGQREEWCEQSAFWKDIYPFMFHDERFASAPQEVDLLLELIGVSAGEVLDLGCGPGRHSVALAQRGFAVTGVDCIPFMLEKARAFARTSRVEVEWKQASMLNYSEEGRFDLAVTLYNSLGYLEHADDNRRVLENVFQSLKSDGVWVIEVLKKEWLIEFLLPELILPIGDGEVVERHRFDLEAVPNRMFKEWELRVGEQKKRHLVSHEIYSAPELSGMLKNAGFAQVEVFGDFIGAPCEAESPRMVLVARKSPKS